MCRQGRKPVVSPKALDAAREFLIAMVGEKELKRTNRKFVFEISVENGDPASVELEFRSKRGRGHRIVGSPQILVKDWDKIEGLVWSDSLKNLLGLCRKQRNKLKPTDFLERDRKRINEILIEAGLPYRLCTKKDGNDPSKWTTRIVRCKD